MDFLEQVSVLILTANEEPNIGRALAALARFAEVIVLDSGSTDKTVEIVAQFANARLVTRPFDGHASQWNFGLHQCGIVRPWVLALDADYLLPTALVDEIEALAPGDDLDGYRADFRYCIHGKPLSGSLYPPHVVLYRRKHANYEQEGHTQRIKIHGRIEGLRGRIDHDDRKAFAPWLAAQQRYARLEANYLASKSWSSLRLVDKVRMTAVLGPIVVFIYTLLVKRCILDGWHGWLYVLQRTIAEMLIAAELVGIKLRRQ